MRLNSKNIFLVDGSGAILTAVLLGLVLPFFSGWLGVAEVILYSLSLLAVLYGIYSFSCFWLVQRIKPWMLKVIISANLVYCLVTLILIITSADMTLWGRIYFVCEILVILGLVAVEASVYQKSFMAAKSNISV